jgi:uncharacterized protein YbjT (DUF2867 family)
MTILVTGATGTTGSEILTLLATERKAPVRALVHTAAKMAYVATRGAEPHLGAFEDPASLRAAMRGADTLILITSANPHAAEQASSAVDAAVEAGMRRIVRISAIKADPNGPTDNTRQHGVTEAKIAASGLAHIILRPSFFMQNLFLAAQSIAEDGQFHFGMGDGRIGMIDTRDIAGCAARCVLSDAWDGKTLELTGPEAISFHAVAETLTTLTGRSVTYAPVSPEAVYDTIRDAGWGDWLAGITCDYARAYAEGWGDFVTGHVEEIFGRPPRSFETFASEVFLPTIDS